MRFMIIVKATKESEAEVVPNPDEELLVAMAEYHEELAKPEHCSMAPASIQVPGVGASSTPARSAPWSMGRSQKPRSSSRVRPHRTSTSGGQHDA